MNFDAVSTYYKRTESLKKTTAHFNISMGKCRKILITTGDFSSPLSITVSQLLSQGMSPKEIEKKLNKSRTAINGYIPYSKGEYDT